MTARACPVTGQVLLRPLSTDFSGFLQFTCRTDRPHRGLQAMLLRQVSQFSGDLSHSPLSQPTPGHISATGLLQEPAYATCINTDPAICFQ